MNIIKEILTQVVQKGTGTKAGIKGWSIAGKTGTEHKVIDGAYSDKYIAEKRPTGTLTINAMKETYNVPHNRGNTPRAPPPLN